MKKQLIILLSLFIIQGHAQTSEKTDLVIDAYGKYYSKSYQESVLLFDQLIKSDKAQKSEWFLYKGVAEFELDQLAQAEIDFKQAIGKGSSEANLWYARLAAISERPGEAVLYIEKYLKQAENPDVLSIKRDTLFARLHNTAEWFSLWQIDWQNEMQKIVADVEYYLKGKDFFNAHSAIDNALVSGINEAVLYALSSKVYESENNLELALNEINMALALDVNNADFMRRKAAYLVQLSKYADALNILSQVIRIVPQDFGTRYARAGIALKTGDYSTAKKEIELYLLYFQSDTAQFLAGQICYMAGDYLKSLRYINPLLEKDKSNASYFKVRGMAYYQTQTYKQAAYDLSMSLDLVPDDAEANFYLGLTEQILGHRKLACYYLNRARTFGDLRAVSYLQENCKE